MDGPFNKIKNIHFEKKNTLYFFIFFLRVVSTASSGKMEKDVLQNTPATLTSEQKLKMVREPGWAPIKEQ